MKILMTGGCGFIGTNAALHFAERGHDVLIVDNFSRNGSRRNEAFLREIAKKEKWHIRIFQRDIVDMCFFKNLITEEEIDVVLHLAAQVAVTTSVESPLLDFEINARGTLNVLEAARLSGRKPIVLYTSSNKVYGSLSDYFLTEASTRYGFDSEMYPGLSGNGISENQLVDFHSPYGCSKGAADQYVRDYYRIYGLPTIVFRMSCIYGPYQYGIVDQGWLCYLTMLAIFGKPITIYGNGKQVRDILCVRDLCRAFEMAISKINTTVGQIYNIGGGPEKTVSVLEFVDILQKRLKQKIKVQFSGWRPGDQKIYVSDIFKAEHHFGWRPQVTFFDCREGMIGWIYKNQEYLRTTV